MSTGEVQKQSSGHRGGLSSPGKGHRDKKGGTALGMKLKKSASVVGMKLRKKPVDKTLSCRYELKYRIHEAKAAAIARFVRSYLPIDHYSKAQPGNSYPILSLYFDSDGLSLCRETLYGKKNRFKLRIRSYSDESNSPCFFEIKRRINDVIVKSRARVKRDDILRILSGKSLPSYLYKADEQTLRQFMLYVNYLNARPVVKLRYLREAYEGISDNRVRVTFDRKVRYISTDKPDVQFNATNWQRLAMNFVILEIKFTDCYPAWLSQMVKYFNLQKGAMSKYVSTVKQSVKFGISTPEVIAYNYG